jgi:hypothetical protein
MDSLRPGRMGEFFARSSPVGTGLSMRENVKSVIVLTLTLYGCALQIGTGDLVGDRKISDDAIRRLRLKQVRPKFKLNQDGTLTAEKVPSSAFRDSTSWKSAYSGRGRGRNGRVFCGLMGEG